MKRILVLEISDSGHHPACLRRILESEFAEHAEVVVAGLPTLFEQPDLQEVRGRFRSVEIEISEKERTCLKDLSRTNLFRRELVVRSIYRRMWRGQRADGDFDLIILPFMDDCFHVMAILGSPFGSTPWIGITMRTRFHLTRMRVAAQGSALGAIDEWLFYSLLRQRSVAALFTIDPVLRDYIAVANRPELRKVLYLPDPVEKYDLPDKTEARARLGLPPGNLILAYGALSERKGVIQLTSALANPACPDSYHLLLAGKMDDRIARFMEGNQAAQLKRAGRLHVIARYLANEELPDLFAASDVMWIGYKDFYTMSGVFVSAGMHEIPAVTCDCGVIGYLSRTKGAGFSVNAASEESIISALRHIELDEHSVKETARRAKELFSGHTAENFSRIISEVVATRIQ